MVDEAVGMTRRRNTESRESTIGTVQIADMTTKNMDFSPPSEIEG